MRLQKHRDTRTHTHTPWAWSWFQATLLSKLLDEKTVLEWSLQTHLLSISNSHLHPITPHSYTDICHAWKASASLLWTSPTSISSCCCTSTSSFCIFASWVFSSRCSVSFPAWESCMCARANHLACANGHALQHLIHCVHAHISLGTMGRRSVG